jgi:hypothetical protein
MAAEQLPVFGPGFAEDSLKAMPGLNATQRWARHAFFTNYTTQKLSGSPCAFLYLLLAKHHFLAPTCPCPISNTFVSLLPAPYPGAGDRIRTRGSGVLKKSVPRINRIVAVYGIPLMTVILSLPPNGGTKALLKLLTYRTPLGENAMK